MAWRPYAGFLVPLACTDILTDVGSQFLNAGIARSSHATDTLAGFGIAMSLITLFASTLSESRQVGLVLATHEQGRRKCLLVVATIGLTMAALMLLLGATQLGVWFVDDFHKTTPEVGLISRRALMFLAPWPLLDGVCRYLSGLLLQRQAATWVSASSIVAIITQIIAVTSLLTSAIVTKNALLLPLVATYAAVASRLFVLVAAYTRRFNDEDVATRAASLEDPRTVKEIIVFMWPLSVVALGQNVSRPIINLFVSRSQVPYAVAALSVSYPLGHLPYGFVNNLKNFPSPFMKNAKDAPTKARVQRELRTAAIITTVLSGVVSAIVLLPSGMHDLILKTWLQTSDGVAAACATPLRIFFWFWLPSAVRAYLTGWGAAERRTSVVGPSAPLRMIALLTFLFAFPVMGVTGADGGVAALLMAFIVEAVAVWLAYYLCFPPLPPLSGGQARLRERGRARLQGCVDEVVWAATTIRTRARCGCGSYGELAEPRELQEVHEAHDAPDTMSAEGSVSPAAEQSVEKV